MDFVYCTLMLVFAAVTIGFVALCGHVEKKP